MMILNCRTAILAVAIAAIVESLENYSLENCEPVLNRHKRYLIHTEGGLYKLVCAVGVPIKLGSKQSVSCAVNLQFQYRVAANTSQFFRPYPPIVRKARAISEQELTYMGIEATMDKYGLNGRECLLRSICENAANPIDHEYNGLFGELIHLVLTPNYAGIDYTDAAKAGKFGIECHSLYPGCAAGDVMDQFIYYM